jgi:hypothetical protein
MRTEEEKKRIKQQAKTDLKKDFIEDKEPVKKDPPKKKYGCGTFGK